MKTVVDKKERKDSWTEEMDLKLAETVLKFLREGKTQTEAYTVVADELDRTDSAVQFRWTSTLKKRYEKAMKLAKEQGKKSKLKDQKAAAKNKQKEAPKSRVAKSNVVKNSEAPETSSSVEETIINENPAAVATPVDVPEVVSETIESTPSVVSIVGSETTGNQEVASELPEEKAPMVSSESQFIRLFSEHVEEFNTLKNSNQDFAQQLKDKDLQLTNALKQIEELQQQLQSAPAAVSVPSDYEDLKDENQALKKELEKLQHLYSFREALLELEPKKDSLKSAVENKVG